MDSMARMDFLNVMFCNLLVMSTIMPRGLMGCLGLAQLYPRHFRRDWYY